MTILIAVNAAYELFFWFFNGDPIIYRILIFRYLSLIGFGCYIGTGGKINKVFSILLLVTGLLFTYLISYLNFDLFVFSERKSTSYLATMFVVPIFYWLSKSNISFKPLQYLGTISYSILFAQMIYYKFFNFVTKQLPYTALRVVCDIIICVVLGIVFDAVVTPVTKKLCKRIKGNI